MGKPLDKKTDVITRVKFIKDLNSRKYTNEELKVKLQSFNITTNTSNLPWKTAVKLFKDMKKEREIAVKNILNIINYYFKLLVKKSIIVPNPIQYKDSWDELNEFWDTIESEIKRNNLLKDNSASVEKILVHLIDLNILTTKSESNMFDIYKRLSLLNDYKPDGDLDVLLHCKTLVVPQQRKISRYIQILRQILLDHFRGIGNISTFLKLCLLAKILLIMSKKKKECQNLLLEFYLKLKIPPKFGKFVEQNKLQGNSRSFQTMKSIIKNIDAVQIFELLYPKGTTNIPNYDSSKIPDEKVPLKTKSKLLTISNDCPPKKSIKKTFEANLKSEQLKDLCPTSEINLLNSVKNRNVEPVSNKAKCLSKELKKKTINTEGHLLIKDATEPRDLFPVSGSISQPKIKKQKKKKILNAELSSLIDNTKEPRDLFPSPITISAVKRVKKGNNSLLGMELKNKNTKAEINSSIKKTEEPRDLFPVLLSTSEGTKVKKIKSAQLGIEEQKKLKKRKAEADIDLSIMKTNEPRDLFLEPISIAVGNKEKIGLSCKFSSVQDKEQPAQLKKSKKGSILKEIDFSDTPSIELDTIIKKRKVDSQTEKYINTNSNKFKVDLPLCQNLIENVNKTENLTESVTKSTNVVQRKRKRKIRTTLIEVSNNKTLNQKENCNKEPSRLDEITVPSKQLNPASMQSAVLIGKQRGIKNKEQIKKQIPSVAHDDKNFLIVNKPIRKEVDIGKNCAILAIEKNVIKDVQNSVNREDEAMVVKTINKNDKLKKKKDRKRSKVLKTNDNDDDKASDENTEKNIAVADEFWNVLTQDDTQVKTKKRIRRKKISKNNGNKSGDSDLEIVEMGSSISINNQQTYSESEGSEIDEASGSDDDIVPCDEKHSMFTNDETSLYDTKFKEERKKIIAVERQKQIDAILDNHNRKELKKQNENKGKSKPGLVNLVKKEERSNVDSSRKTKPLLNSKEDASLDKDVLISLYRNEAEKNPEIKFTNVKNINSDSELMKGTEKVVELSEIAGKVDSESDLKVIYETIEMDRKINKNTANITGMMPKRNKAVNSLDILNQKAASPMVDNYDTDGLDIICEKSHNLKPILSGENNMDSLANTETLFDSEVIEVTNLNSPVNNTNTQKKLVSSTLPDNLKSCSKEENSVTLVDEQLNRHSFSRLQSEEFSETCLGKAFKSIKNINQQSTPIDKMYKNDFNSSEPLCTDPLSSNENDNCRVLHGSNNYDADKNYTLNSNNGIGDEQNPAVIEDSVFLNDDNSNLPESSNETVINQNSFSKHASHDSGSKYKTTINKTKNVNLNTSNEETSDLKLSDTITEDSVLSTSDLGDEAYEAGCSESSDDCKNKNLETQLKIESKYLSEAFTDSSRRRKSSSASSKLSLDEKLASPFSNVAYKSPSSDCISSKTKTTLNKTEKKLVLSPNTESVPLCLQIDSSDEECSNDKTKLTDRESLVSQKDGKNLQLLEDCSSKHDVKDFITRGSITETIYNLNADKTPVKIDISGSHNCANSSKDVIDLPTIQNTFEEPELNSPSIKRKRSMSSIHLGSTIESLLSETTYNNTSTSEEVNNLLTNFSKIEDNKENIENNEQEGEELEVLSTTSSETDLTSIINNSEMHSSKDDCCLPFSPTLAENSDNSKLVYTSSLNSKKKKMSQDGKNSSKRNSIDSCSPRFPTPQKVPTAALMGSELIISPGVSDEENEIGKEINSQAKILESLTALDQPDPWIKSKSPQKITQEEQTEIIGKPYRKLFLPSKSPLKLAAVDSVLSATACIKSPIKILSKSPLKTILPSPSKHTSKSPLISITPKKLSNISRKKSPSCDVNVISMKQSLSIIKSPMNSDQNLSIEAFKRSPIAAKSSRLSLGKTRKSPRISDNHNIDSGSTLEIQSSSNVECNSSVQDIKRTPTKLTDNISEEIVSDQEFTVVTPKFNNSQEKISRLSSNKKAKQSPKERMPEFAEDAVTEKEFTNVTPKSNNSQEKSSVLSSNKKVRLSPKERTADLADDMVTEKEFSNVTPKSNNSQEKSSVLSSNKKARLGLSPKERMADLTKDMATEKDFSSVTPKSDNSLEMSSGLSSNKKTRQSPKEKMADSTEHTVNEKDFSNVTPKSNHSQEKISRLSTNKKTRQSPKETSSLNIDSSMETSDSIKSEETSAELDSEDRDIVLSPVKRVTRSSIILRRLGNVPAVSTESLLNSPRRSRRSSISSLVNEDELLSVQKTLASPARPTRPRRNSSSNVPLTPVRRSRRISGLIDELPEIN